MASSWGYSFGKAWGNSWGTNSPVSSNGSSGIRRLWLVLLQAQSLEEAKQERKEKIKEQVDRIVFGGGKPKSIGKIEIVQRRKRKVADSVHVERVPKVPQTFIYDDHFQNHLSRILDSISELPVEVVGVVEDDDEEEAVSLLLLV